MNAPEPESTPSSAIGGGRVVGRKTAAVVWCLASFPLPWYILTSVTLRIFHTGETAPEGSIDLFVFIGRLGLGILPLGYLLGIPLSSADVTSRYRGFLVRSVILHTSYLLVGTLVFTDAFDFFSLIFAS